MSIQLYLNNGDIFDVVDMLDIPTDFIGYPNSGLQIAPWSPPITWINGQSYIQDSWEAHFSESAGHTYGWFNFLNGRATKAAHQEYLNKVLANGAFIWGDAYNGGLYIYKSYYREGYTTGCLYGLALFCGYGVDNNDNNYDIFSIEDYPTASGLTWEQIETISIIHWYSLMYTQGWITDEYYSFLVGGNIIENGHCVTKQGFGQLESSDPLNPNRYTGISYTFSMATTPVSETLLDYPEIVTIQPINPLYVNYEVPMKIWMNHRDGEGDGYYTPQSFGAPTTLEIEGFDTMGDWAGGGGNLVPSDPNGGGINTTGGGYGDPSKQSDRSGDTGAHQFDDDGTDVGCFTIFNPTKAQLTAFNRWLFQSMFDAGFESMWNNLKKMYADPSEYIIGMGVIKYVPDKEATQSTEIKFGNVGTAVFARTVKQWSEVDCGSIQVNEQYKSFLDYQGFSTVKIFLPFCGTYDLDQNDVMGSKISLKYNIDNLTGACVAVLDIERADRGKWDDSSIHSKIYRFNGNCMQQLPISEKNYSNSLAAVAGLCSSVVSGAASAATGNAIGVIGGVAGAVSSATNLAPDIIQSGKISDAYGMLDCLNPFIILHRPIRSIPAEYGKHAGYPAMLFKKIGTCKGFTKVRAGGSWTNTFPCTDDEKMEIQKYLENGIMLPE